LCSGYFAKWVTAFEKAADEQGTEDADVAIYFNKALLNTFCCPIIRHGARSHAVDNHASVGAG
jgi:hypothetical protein